MVFKMNAKKGKTPNQKTPAKKFEKKETKDMPSFLYDDDDDMDSDGSSGDDVVVTKTPKGKQTPNEKRVSFAVTGKNTPVKTPVGKKNATPAKLNSVSKKQATPGKVELQKFMGIGKNQSKKSNKSAQPEDDDDEDDDDDENEDDDDDEDDDDFTGDLDLNMGSDDEEDDDDEDDDDEDDDNEDDDEDDDDDDEDEEEEEGNQKNLNNKNQKQNQQTKKTPVKASEKQTVQNPKNVQTPKGAQVQKTPKSKDTQSPKGPQKENNANSSKQSIADPVRELEEQRRRERDVCQLYLGNVPKEVTSDELKELSADIVAVNLIRRPKMKNAFAFLQFASEAKAEENLKKLKTKPFKGSTLNVDYVGFKSSRKAKESEQVQYNTKKLYVSGLPVDVSISKIAEFFPKSCSIVFNQSPVFRTATVSYWSEADASAAFQESKNFKLNDMPLSVLHSRQGKKEHSKRKRSAQKKNKKQGNNQPAKKMKYDESDSE